MSVDDGATTTVRSLSLWEREQIEPAAPLMIRHHDFQPWRDCSNSGLRPGPVHGLARCNDQLGAWVFCRDRRDQRARKTPRLANVCDVRHISLRESRITTTPLFDCAQRSNRSQPYELALLLSPYGTGQD